jgi:hypothetical protein
MRVECALNARWVNFVNGSRVVELSSEHGEKEANSEVSQLGLNGTAR